MYIFNVFLYLVIFNIQISSSEEYACTVRAQPDFCNRAYLYTQVAHVH